MFKAWNIINNLLSSYTYGHVLWETKLLVEELQHRGMEARLFGHRSIKQEDYPGARIIPAIDLHYAQTISEDPEWEFLENLVVHNLAYEKSLEKVARDVFENSLTVIPDISERQLLGTVRWFDRFAPLPRPRLAVILRGQVDWTEANPSLEMLRKIWATCPDSAKRHVRFCVRSEMSARKYEQLLGIKPHILPSALAPTAREIRATKERIGPQSGSFIVSFLAGSRLERGAGIIPDVVKACAPLGVRFLIQLTDAIDARPETLAALKSLRDRPEVQFHEGTLSRQEYNDWIAQSVVLLPYGAENYVVRSSGVYLEARTFGSPVIVPPGTWMAEEVSRLGNGLVFEQYSPASIAQSIARAQKELPALRERAAVAAGDYRREHGADRCVDALEALFDDR